MSRLIKIIIMILLVRGALYEVIITQLVTERQNSEHFQVTAQYKYIILIVKVHVFC
jgi:hypothetical protein